MGVSGPEPRMASISQGWRVKGVRKSRLVCLVLWVMYWAIS